MWSLWPCVHTTATTCRPPTASSMALASWAASMTITSESSPTIQMLLSTSQLPPSSSKVPWVTTRSMPRHHRTTTERSTSPACILWNAVLDTVQADAFGDELLQRQPALPVQADQGGEVALGQAVAVPGRLQRAAAGEEVHQRHVQSHVGRRNTNQHNGSGQIAGVEGLLPGLRAADGVDHHVGAEPVGEVLDGLDRRRARGR